MRSFHGDWLNTYEKQDFRRYTRLTFPMALVINELSIKEQYIVVTKDSDFVESFLLSREPWKLFLVATGNIGNNELETLFLANVKTVVDGFEVFDFIELSRTSVIFHV